MVHGSTKLKFYATCFDSMRTFIRLYKHVAISNRDAMSLNVRYVDGDQARKNNTTRYPPGYPAWNWTRPTPQAPSEDTSQQWVTTSIRVPYNLTKPLTEHYATSHNLNPLTPNNSYRGRTAPLTSKVAFYIFIQQIYVLNILNMVYTLIFSLQNSVCFIIITYLVPVLFIFYIQWYLG